jgi:RsiW-degrading membrane proteinase PrsW (M82 family)
MADFDPILAALATASAVGWSLAGAARVARGQREVALRGLLGGAAAFGVALSAYQLLSLGGLDPRWERVLGGGWPAVIATLIIGLVEEGAKLAGLLLVVRQAWRPGQVMAMTIGVAAAFGGLETALSLAGGPPPAAIARALLSPVAHAVLAAPLGFAVAHAARRGRRVALVVLPLALGVSALLHAAGDLSLASPRWGQLGYASALLAPVLALFLHARLAPAPVPLPQASGLRARR